MTLEHNEWKRLGDAAYEALLGLRDDVYPCREDVPADLWGKPIYKKPIVSDGGELGSTGVEKEVETDGWSRIDQNYKCKR